ncbi:helix-turn-helix transcriptional regulator [Nesterenkonia sp. F]|uniref:ArsR/SmtB family transcription factor n=1 Tax=Nesterenkonia sp. F TaxID=795955 RepID=UPI000255CCF2|nr:helix-turn-helix domain-containing protein [Nesterenkonia sp. F]
MVSLCPEAGPALDDAETDRLFHALADATRRDIVRRTLVAEQSISRLADTYAMSFAAVGKHVGVLTAAGLVSKHASGRERLVRAEPARIRQIRRLLDRFAEIEAGRVARLDAMLAEDERG